jgi:hypothetical protein
LSSEGEAELPKFEIRVSERAADWREAHDGDAAMQCSSDAVSGEAPLQSMTGLDSESAPPAAMQCMNEPVAPSALQSVIDPV